MNIEVMVHCAMPNTKNNRLAIPERNSFAVPFIVGQICNFPKEQRKNIDEVRQSLQSLSVPVSGHAHPQCKTSIEDRACRVALCFVRNTREYVCEILKQLNLCYKIQTLGTSKSFRLTGACWITIPEQESFITQIKRIEDHSIAQIILIVCTESEFGTLPDDFDVDLTIRLSHTGEMDWIIDRDDTNARHSGVLSPYEASNAIQSILNGDDFHFDEGGVE
ncbi:MAG: hypothetical protein Q4D42_13000, partial [Eubacteriales bacterium]|nr:hypothetical protein [Eubacteriales bacterium]